MIKYIEMIIYIALALAVIPLSIEAYNSEEAMYKRNFADSKWYHIFEYIGMFLGCVVVLGLLAAVIYFIFNHIKIV